MSACVVECHTALGLAVGPCNFSVAKLACRLAGFLDPGFASSKWVALAWQGAAHRPWTGAGSPAVSSQGAALLQASQWNISGLQVCHDSPLQCCSPCCYTLLVLGPWPGLWMEVVSMMETACPGFSVQESSWTTQAACSSLRRSSTYNLLGLETCCHQSMAACALRR